MSSQTIYFDNPQSITNLQTTTTTQGSQINILQRQNGTDVTIDPTMAIPNMNKFIQSQCCVPGSASATSGVGVFNYFSVFGNAYSGQEYFVSTGAISSTNSLSPTGSNYVALASTAKICLPLTVAKLIEEGYFSPSDTVVTYLSDFTGNAYYYTSGTGTYASTASNANLATYTGAKATFNLNTVTIAQVMGLQLGAPYPLACLGNFLANWAITANSNPEWTFNVAMRDTYNCLNNGLSLGATGSLTGAGYGTAIREYQYGKYFGDFATVEGYETDYYNSVLATVKSGQAPWSFKPGDAILSPNSIYSTRSQYAKFAWTVLSAVCSAAIRRKQGSSSPYFNVVDYFKAKFCTPMNITGTWFAGYEAAPADYSTNTLESCFRHSTVYSNPSNWVATGTSPSYTTSASGTVQWASAFPDDGLGSNRLGDISTWPGFYDRIGGAWEGRISMRINDIVKFYKLILNNGVHIPLGQTTGTRLLSTSTIKFLFNNACAPSDTFEAYGGFSRETGNYRFCIGGFAKLEDSLSHLSQSLIVTGATLPTIPYPLSPSTCQWQGSSGVSYFFDLDTGYYAFGGSQHYLIGQSSAPFSLTDPSPLFANIVYSQLK